MKIFHLFVIFIAENYSLYTKKNKLLPLSNYFKCHFYFQISGCPFHASFSNLMENSKINNNKIKIDWKKKPCLFMSVQTFGAAVFCPALDASVHRLKRIFAYWVKFKLIFFSNKFSNLLKKFFRTKKKRWFMITQNK